MFQKFPTYGTNTGLFYPYFNLKFDYVHQNTQISTVSATLAVSSQVGVPLPEKMALLALKRSMETLPYGLGRQGRGVMWLDVSS